MHKDFTLENLRIFLVRQRQKVSRNDTHSKISFVEVCRNETSITQMLLLAQQPLYGCFINVINATKNIY